MGNYRNTFGSSFVFSFEMFGISPVSQPISVPKTCVFKLLPVGAHLPALWASWDISCTLAEAVLGARGGSLRTIRVGGAGPEPRRGVAALLLGRGTLLLLRLVWSFLPRILLLALLLWPGRGGRGARLHLGISASHHHATWPGVLVVGIPAANVHRVTGLSVHTGNERNPEQLHLWAVALRRLRHHTLEVTVGLWDTLHRAWTHDKRLLAGGSHWP